MASDGPDLAWSVDSPFGKALKNLDAGIGSALHGFEVEMRGLSEEYLTDQAMLAVLLRLACYIAKARGMSIDDFVEDVKTDVALTEAFDGGKEPVQ